MLVFIYTEFTDFVQINLLSIALVGWPALIRYAFANRPQNLQWRDSCRNTIASSVKDPH